MLLLQLNGGEDRLLLGNPFGVVPDPQVAKAQGHGQQQGGGAEKQPFPPPDFGPKLVFPEAQRVPHRFFPGLLPPLTGEQLGHCQVQGLRQGLQQGDVRAAQAPLPFAHCLGGYVKCLCQVLLGLLSLPTHLGNQISSFDGVHSTTSFTGILPQNRGSWQSTGG